MNEKRSRAFWCQWILLLPTPDSRPFSLPKNFASSCSSGELVLSTFVWDTFHVSIFKVEAPTRKSPSAVCFTCNQTEKGKSDEKKEKNGNDDFHGVYEFSGRRQSEWESEAKKKQSSQQQQQHDEKRSIFIDTSAQVRFNEPVSRGGKKSFFVHTWGAPIGTFKFVSSFHRIRVKEKQRRNVDGSSFQLCRVTKHSRAEWENWNFRLADCFLIAAKSARVEVINRITLPICMFHVRRVPNWFRGLFLH